MTSEPEAREYWDDVGLATLLAGFFAGPLVWGLTLQVNYSLAKWACLAGMPALLSGVSLIALAAAGGGFWLSWRSWRKLRGHSDLKGAQVVDRSYFLAVAGMTLNAIFALLILTSTTLPLIVRPCQ